MSELRSAKRRAHSFLVPLGTCWRVGSFTWNMDSRGGSVAASGEGDVCMFPSLLGCECVGDWARGAHGDEDILPSSERLFCSSTGGEGGV